MPTNFILSSWLVLRSQSLEETSPSVSAESGEGADSSERQGVITSAVDWCDDADDWGRY